jgi:hypothetical protein
MKLAEDLRASLDLFLAGGAVEIRESGSRMSPAGKLLWEVRGAENKPLLHLWSENCNVTRRVLAIADQSDDCLALAVERFGKTKPDRLVIMRRDYARSPRELSREEYCEQLRRILAEQFPDETLEKISIAADLEHSLSRVYARGISRRGTASFAFLAVSEAESLDAVESSLTYALLWLERARRSQHGNRICALRLILPQGKSSVLAYRLAAIDPRLAVQIFELDPLREVLERINPTNDGNVMTALVPRRETQLLLDRAEAAIAPVVALAPRSIRVHASATREVHLRFNGLTFARWQDGNVLFGLEGPEQELTPATGKALRQLIAKLGAYRHPQASDLRHPWFRAQAERWMQSVILDDVSRVDVSLDPAHVYEQVFAQGGGQHGIIDLLCVTRGRRLAILELKATENLNLPLQAADYYSRVRQHLAEGNLARYGYFTGLELQQTPPLVYLVAPALRFHPSTDDLLHYLAPEMEVIRVGLAENWRCAVRVVMRQKGDGREN